MDGIEDNIGEKQTEKVKKSRNLEFLVFVLLSARECEQKQIEIEREGEKNYFKYCYLP